MVQYWLPCAPTFLDPVFHMPALDCTGAVSGLGSSQVWPAFQLHPATSKGPQHSQVAPGARAQSGDTPQSRRGSVPVLQAAAAGRPWGLVSKGPGDHGSQPASCQAPPGSPAPLRLAPGPSHLYVNYFSIMHYTTVNIFPFLYNFLKNIFFFL